MKAALRTQAELYANQIDEPLSALPLESLLAEIEQPKGELSNLSIKLCPKLRSMERVVVLPQKQFIRQLGIILHRKCHSPSAITIELERSSSEQLIISIKGSESTKELFQTKSLIKLVGGELSIGSSDCGQQVVTISLPLLETHYDAILLDDDQLIRLMWKRIAAKRGEQIFTAASWSKLKPLLSTFDRNVTIYLDYCLHHEELSGAHVAQLLGQQGFNNILLTTCMPQGRVDKTVWVKEILDKSEVMNQKRVSKEGRR
jgi:hypothetical protein